MDAASSAAMGLVETLVHTHDLARGLGLDWDPPAEICARVLNRLFPDAPRGTEPWATLLWVTGRAEAARASAPDTVALVQRAAVTDSVTETRRRYDRNRATALLRQTMRSSNSPSLAPRTNAVISAWV